MMTDVITLVAQTETVDEYGARVLSESAREVFAEVKSVSGKEFYQAHAVGLQPEVKFMLADYFDYEDEKIVEHDGQRYRVLRTYRTGQNLELTCYREVNP